MGNSCCTYLCSVKDSVIVGLQEVFGESCCSEQDYVDYYKEAVLLMVGVPGSGKTTVSRQFRRVYYGDYMRDELPQIRLEVEHALDASIVTLLQTVSQTEGFKDNPQLQRAVKEMLLYANNIESLSHETLQKMPSVLGSLWSYYKSTPEYGRLAPGRELDDHLDYFLKHILRLADVRYVPRSMDILKVNRQTERTAVTLFSYSKRLFRVVDMGYTQMTFDLELEDRLSESSAILFTAGIADFHKHEDSPQPSLNYLASSFALFDALLRNKSRKNKRVLVLLTKIDLLPEKLQRFRFQQYFPQYEGSNEMDPIVDYVRREFLLRAARQRWSAVSVHTIAVTEDESFQEVLDLQMPTLTRSSP